MTVLNAPHEQFDPILFAPVIHIRHSCPHISESVRNGFDAFVLDGACIVTYQRFDTEPERIDGIFPIKSLHPVSKKLEESRNPHELNRARYPARPTICVVIPDQD